MREHVENETHICEMEQVEYETEKLLIFLNDSMFPSSNPNQSCKHE